MSNMSTVGTKVFRHYVSCAETYIHDKLVETEPGQLLIVEVSELREAADYSKRLGDMDFDVLEKLQERLWRDNLHVSIVAYVELRIKKLSGN